MTEERIRKIAPLFFVFTISCLGIFSGFYTFAGLGLLIDNTFLAIVLTSAIQITIATTVTSLPFVAGVTRAALLVFYLLFLCISSATGYIYILNQQVDAVDEQFILTEVAKTTAAELAIVQGRRTDVREMQATLQAEQDIGTQPGAGPGRGPRYQEMLLNLNRREAELAIAEEEYKTFEAKSQNLQSLLMNRRTDQTSEEVFPLIAELASLAHAGNPEKEKLVKSYKEAWLTPTERAIKPLVEGEWASVSVLSSITWSILFDTAALAIGLLWVSFTPRRTLQHKEAEIEQIESVATKEEELVEYLKNLLNATVAREELSMLRSEVRADSLYRIGLSLLVISVFCPLIAGLVYLGLDPLPDETLEKLIRFREGIGTLPKDFAAHVARDWHMLLAGITLGFLCLAAARGILTQQAKEMRESFRLNERVNYYERLRSVLEIKARQLGDGEEAENELVDLAVTGLLNEPPVGQQEGEFKEKTDDELARVLQTARHLRT